MDVEVLVTNRVCKTEIKYVEGIKVYKVADLGRVLSAPLSPLSPLPQSDPQLLASPV